MKSAPEKNRKNTAKSARKAMAVDAALRREAVARLQKRKQGGTVVASSPVATADTGMSQRNPRARAPSLQSRESRDAVENPSRSRLPRNSG